MTISTRIALGVSAAALSLSLALVPAAFAMDKMGKDGGMKKESMSKSSVLRRLASRGGPVPSERYAKRDTRLFSLLARGIARVACCLALGLKGRLPRRGFFLFARELGSSLRRRLSLKALLLGFDRFTRQFGLGPLGGLRFALGLALHHSRIVRARLAAKLVQDVLPRLLRGLLPVCEARFFESTH